MKNPFSGSTRVPRVIGSAAILAVLASILLAQPLHAADRITVTVTITNTPADGNTLVVNSDTRTWKTSVATPASQIAIGPSIGANATNLYSHIAANPYSGPLALLRSGTNGIQLIGTVGGSLSASISGTWASLSYSTQTVVSATVVRVPITAEPTASVQTNIASLLVSNVFNLGLSTEKILAASSVMDNFVDTSQSQTVAGAKTFTGANTYQNVGQLYTGGSISNVTSTRKLIIPYATNINGIYFQNNLSSNVYTIIPDTDGRPSIYAVGSSEEHTTVGSYVPTTANIINGAIGDNRYGRLGSANTWTALNVFSGAINGSSWYGGDIVGGNISGTAVNLTNGTYYTPTLRSAINRITAFESYVNDSRNLELGGGASVSNTITSGIALGWNSLVMGPFGVAIGRDSKAGYDRSVAIGYQAEALAANQIRLGTSTETVSVPGSIAVNNLTVTNSMTLSGGTWNNAVLTNGINRGRAFFTFINDASNVEIGTNATVTAGMAGSVAIGQAANANHNNAVAIGHTAVVNHSKSVAIGNDATTTEASQIRLGTSGENVSIPGEAYVAGNFSVGSDNPTFPAALAKGVYILTGTAPSADPGGGLVIWADTSGPSYRTQVTDEGAGANNHLHNRAAQTIGAGSNFAVPDANWNRIDFGTTDPDISLPTAGTYLLHGAISFNGGSAGTDIFKGKFFNSTDATDVLPIGHVANVGVNEETQIILSAVVTVGGTKTIQLYFQNASAARGTVIATETAINYARLY